MSDDQSGKREVKINDFKVPKDWHALVKKVAHDRRTSFSSAVIYLVELGLKLHKVLKEREPAAIQEAIAIHLATGPPGEKKTGAG